MFAVEGEMVWYIVVISLLLLTIFVLGYLATCIAAFASQVFFWILDKLTGEG